MSQNNTHEDKSKTTNVIEDLNIEAIAGQSLSQLLDQYYRFFHKIDKSPYKFDDKTDFIKQFAQNLSTMTSAKGEKFNSSTIRLLTDRLTSRLEYPIGWYKHVNIPNNHEKIIREFNTLSSVTEKKQYLNRLKENATPEEWENRVTKILLNTLYNIFNVKISSKENK